jgi:hypothetical protein
MDVAEQLLARALELDEVRQLRLCVLARIAVDQVLGVRLADVA